MPIPPHHRVDQSRALIMLNGSDNPAHHATHEEIDAALAQVDQDTIFDKHRSVWTAQKWDRTSPINGVPAEHWLAREDVPEAGDIYLLLRDGELVGFQPHRPHVMGVAPIDDWEAESGAHMDTIAAGGAHAEIVAHLRGHVAAMRQTTGV